MARKRSLNPSAKRAAILHAGERLFATQGFARTTMAQVAVAADVAVGSVYRAFPDKLSLLTALHGAMEQHFIGAIVASWRLDRRPAERFRDMIAGLFTLAAATREVMPLYLLTRDLVSSGGPAPGARTIEVIAGLYAEGVAASEFIDLPPQTAAAIAYGMVEGGMRDWMPRSELDAANDLIDALAQCFERSFVRIP